MEKKQKKISYGRLTFRIAQTLKISVGPMRAGTKLIFFVTGSHVHWAGRDGVAFLDFGFPAPEIGPEYRTS